MQIGFFAVGIGPSADPEIIALTKDAVRREALGVRGGG